MAIYMGYTKVAGDYGTGDSALSAQISTHDGDIKTRLSALEDGVNELREIQAYGTGIPLALDFGNAINATFKSSAVSFISSDSAPFDMSFYAQNYLSTGTADTNYGMNLSVDDCPVPRAYSNYDLSTYSIRVDIPAGAKFVYKVQGNGGNTAYTKLIPYKYGVKMFDMEKATAASGHDIYANKAFGDDLTILSAWITKSDNLNTVWDQDRDWNIQLSTIVDNVAYLHVVLSSTVAQALYVDYADDGTGRIDSYYKCSDTSAAAVYTNKNFFRKTYLAPQNKYVMIYSHISKSSSTSFRVSTPNHWLSSIASQPIDLYIS